MRRFFSTSKNGIECVVVAGGGHHLTPIVSCLFLALVLQLAKTKDEALRGVSLPQGRRLALLVVMLWAGSGFDLAPEKNMPLRTPASLDAVGRRLLAGDATGFLVPFEAVSILLVTALIGAVVIGVVVGFVLGQAHRLQAMFAPVLEFLRAIPAVALIPLVIIVLGLDDTAKVILITFICLWPVLLNTEAAKL